MTIQNMPCAAVRVVLAVLALGVAQVAWGQNSTTAPAKSAESRQDDFYRGDSVQSVYLQVDKDDMETPAGGVARANLCAGFVSLAGCFHRRSGDPLQRKQFLGFITVAQSAAFLIKFDDDDDDQRFLGLRRVSFDNGVQFGSVFSEPIITEILRDQGIKTHRCNYAKLFLNDEYRGVYVNVERIDESFIERNLSDPNGMLFKVDEGGPGGNLQFVGDDPSVYKKAFEPQTRSAKKGQKQLIEFIRMINESKDDALAANLESKMELNDFLRVTAVMLFSGAFDQLTGWSPHNYYLYHDGKSDRWRYFPWDLDVGFAETAFGQINVLADWNAAWPTAGQLPNPLLDRIVADPRLLQRYRDTARIILDKYFEPERLCAILDAKYELIKDDLKTDPFPSRRITNPEDRSYDDILRSIKQFVRKRYSSARQQLDHPGKRPAMSRPPGGPPPQLVEKVHRIERAAQQMQQNGKDIAPIQKVIEKVGPLLQQGKMPEAEKLLDQALKLAGEVPGDKKQ